MLRCMFRHLLICCFALCIVQYSLAQSTGGYGSAGGHGRGSAGGYGSNGGSSNYIVANSAGCNGGTYVASQSPFKQVGLFARLQARRSQRQASRQSRQNEVSSSCSNGNCVSTSGCGCGCPDCTGRQGCNCSCADCTCNGTPVTCSCECTCPSCGHKFTCDCNCRTGKMTARGDQKATPPAAKSSDGEQPLNPDRPPGMKAPSSSTQPVGTKDKAV